eukprot:3672049-Pyramimonas_sp.AAC.1
MGVGDNVDGMQQGSDGGDLGEEHDEDEPPARAKAPSMMSIPGVDGEGRGTSLDGGEGDPEEDEEDDDESEEEQDGPFLLSGRARPAHLVPGGALDGAVAPSCTVRMAALTKERAASRLQT